MLNTENHTTSDSVDPLVAELQAVVGTFPPTAEQIAKNKARKTELEFQALKSRLENQDRKMAALKEAVRRKLKGASDE